MTSPSTVKAALVAAWATALPGSQVIYGTGTAVTTTKARILIVGNAVGTRTLTSLDGTSSMKQYAVNCLVSVALSGTDMQAAEDMAFADYEAACDAVTALSPDLGLGGGISIAAQDAFEQSSIADQNGRAAQVSFSVLVADPN